MARPRSFDEDEVLRVARDQFWSTGYAAARVDDIAAATGLGKGSLYGAFGDKHQLFLRTFDDHCAGLTEAVRRALDGPDAGACERLRAHVLAVANATASDACLRGLEAVLVEAALDRPGRNTAALDTEAVSDAARRG